MIAYYVTFITMDCIHHKISSISKSAI